MDAPVVDAGSSEREMRGTVEVAIDEEEEKPLSTIEVRDPEVGEQNCDVPMVEGESTSADLVLRRSERIGRRPGRLTEEFVFK